MVILLFLHMARTFFFGAYKYPRELTWLTGAILFILVMAMSFTGYLLVFDQRAYWATVVGVNINGTGADRRPVPRQLPEAGPELQRADALALLLAAHARDAGRDRALHLPAQLARREARRHLSSVVAQALRRVRRARFRRGVPVTLHADEEATCRG